MPGFKRGPDGHVSLTRIADRLHVDRRVLKRLWELGQIAGVREGGVIWLERRSLAAYLWSRPRCVRCGRRVIGRGPGCDRHRREGRRRRRVVVRPRKQRSLSGDRNDRLHEGHLRYRDDVERVKAERGLLDVDELLKRLRRAGVPRSPGAISGHLRDGLLERERDLGFDKPYLFTTAAADGYIARLRDYRDGRLARFNATTPEQAKSRGALYLARHKSTAEAGRASGGFNVILRRPDKKPVGHQSALADEPAVVAEIHVLRAGGFSEQHIADALTARYQIKVTRKMVRVELGRQRPE